MGRACRPRFALVCLVVLGVLILVFKEELHALRESWPHAREEAALVPVAPQDQRLLEAFHSLSQAQQRVVQASIETLQRREEKKAKPEFEAAMAQFEAEFQERFRKRVSQDLDRKIPPKLTREEVVDVWNKQMGKTIRVRSMSGLCWDANPGAPGTRFSLYPCYSGENRYQNFRLKARGMLMSDSGTCVAVRKGALVLEACHSDDRPPPEQIWSQQRAPHDTSEFVFLSNKQSGLCIQAADSEIVAAPCANACDQLWYITLREPGSAPPALGPEGFPALPPRTPSSRQGRILCWILTHEGEHTTRALNVYRTWVKRCDGAIFVSNATDRVLPVVILDPTHKEEKTSLWPKSRAAWTYVYRHFIDDFDWFIKADTDSYFVMRNLRMYLSTLSPDTPYELGRRLTSTGNAQQVYDSGGSGIILSRAALQVLGSSVTKDPSLWVPNDHGAEDRLLGLTLAKLGIKPHDTRDEKKRNRFIVVGLRLEHGTWRSKNMKWLEVADPEAIEGNDCCVAEWVSTHYIKGEEMYALSAMEQAQCHPSVDTWPYLQFSNT